MPGRRGAVLFQAMGAVAPARRKNLHRGRQKSRRPPARWPRVEPGAGMLSPRYILPLHDELVIDLFAGGVGASCGINLAMDRSVDVAINHDPEAIGLPQANHPQTRHYCADVFEVDPVAVTHGRPVGLLWASPDSKHFSKTKHRKPTTKKI